jgi:hypothetical protein
MCRFAASNAKNQKSSLRATTEFLERLLSRNSDELTNEFAAGFVGSNVGIF